MLMFEGGNDVKNIEPEIKEMFIQCYVNVLVENRIFAKILLFESRGKTAGVMGVEVGGTVLKETVIRFLQYPWKKGKQ